MQLPSELHVHKAKSCNPSENGRQKVVTLSLGREEARSHAVLEYVPSGKLLSITNWKPLPSSICPSELTVGFLPRHGKGTLNYNAQFHIISPSLNKAS